MGVTNHLLTGMILQVLLQTQLDDVLIWTVLYSSKFVDVFAPIFLQETRPFGFVQSCWQAHIENKNAYKIYLVNLWSLMP